MWKHKSHVACAILAGAIGAASVACGGNRGASQQASTAATTKKVAPTVPGPPQHATHGARTPSSGTLGPPQAQGGEDSEADDAELVVGREVIQQCPQLVLVRSHMGEIDPDMIWLAVLEALADCMAQDGPLAAKSIGVSGDEEHRHVVREVLGARGVAPTRVVATPISSRAAAMCQGGVDCNKRVEITILAQ
jgi:hypothetical protein